MEDFTGIPTGLDMGYQDIRERIDGLTARIEAKNYVQFEDPEIAQAIESVKNHIKGDFLNCRTVEKVKKILEEEGDTQDLEELKILQGIIGLNMKWRRDMHGMSFEKAIEYLNINALGIRGTLDTLKFLIKKAETYPQILMLLDHDIFKNIELNNLIIKGIIYKLLDDDHYNSKKYMVKKWIKAFDVEGASKKEAKHIMASIILARQKGEQEIADWLTDLVKRTKHKHVL